MTGKKRMRRLALTGALLMLCTNTAAGCRQQEKQEVTPEVLMDAVDKNMKEVNSASSSLEIEVELEDVLDHTRIRMDMDMENTVSPRAGHAKGRTEVKLFVPTSTRTSRPPSNRRTAVNPSSTS